MKRKNNFPEISIVTPSLNQSFFLEETIKSVISQNYPNLEYVVIDGGSTDGSVDIIKQYEKHLAYWVSEKDRGHAHALNKGFSETSGGIMAWINSDDKYTPWALETVSKIFEQFPHVMWLVGFNAWWNVDGAMTHAKRINKNIYDYLIGNHLWIQQESVFWRRSLWEMAGGHIEENYEFMVDGELWSRFFLHAELYTVDCILGGYRFHNTNRVKLNYQACLSEMDKAVSDMKKVCPDDVLKTADRLKKVKKIVENPVVKFLPLETFFRKYLNKKAYSAANYKNIFCKDGRWHERNLPFFV